jgi:FKBP-type peptidyl-prolyl cis-trans isomerase 2/predicted Fe-Mo cluster-binding NifX family protein
LTHGLLPKKDQNMLIAIPTDAPGGLDAPVSGHFGHCEIFTLVHVEDGQVGEVILLPNAGHEHGGCMAPVHFLKDNGVEVLLAGGMGMRPLAGFQSVGIEVYFKENAKTVKEAVDLYVDGKCQQFGEAQTCGGGSGGCGGHGEHRVERPAIDGPADVRNGRVVSLAFEMKDEQGNVIDSASEEDPMMYLQGSGSILGLEKAIEGLEAGAEVSVDVPPEDGFGERDEKRIVNARREQLPSDIKEGDLVTSELPNGAQVHLVVMEITDEVVRLDGNHPLAGMTLHFDIKVMKVEAATAEEIEHGHIH